MDGYYQLSQCNIGNVRRDSFFEELTRAELSAIDALCADNTGSTSKEISFRDIGLAALELMGHFIGYMKQQISVYRPVNQQHQSIPQPSLGYSPDRTS